MLVEEGKKASSGASARVSSEAFEFVVKTSWSDSNGYVGGETDEKEDEEEPDEAAS